MLALAAAAPVAAQQACPTLADLDGTGIAIEMDDGTLELATRLTPDVVRMTGSFPEDPGSGYRIDLAQGVYTLVYQDIFDGMPDTFTRASYSYPQAAADLPAPAPDGVVTLDALGLEGGSFFMESQTFTFGPAYTLEIDGCSFEAVDFDIVYDGDPSLVESFIYLPELSISYLAGFVDSAGEQVYEAVRIYVP